MTWFTCCCKNNSDQDENDLEVYQVKDTNNSNYNNNVSIHFQIKNDLTKDPIRSSTIQELKSKLGNKEIEDVDTEEVMIPETQRGVPHPPPPPHISVDGLIIPRKPHNPVLDNAERQNLHKELLFNQKIGKNVLNQKSELQRALEKHKENIAKKELENNIAAQTPELKKVIADRAKRLEEINTPTQNEDCKGLNTEFLQARAKLKTRMDSK